jgi:hypothetical protein
MLPPVITWHATFRTLSGDVFGQALTAERGQREAAAFRELDKGVEAPAGAVDRPIVHQVSEGGLEVSAVGARADSQRRDAAGRAVLGELQQDRELHTLLHRHWGPQTANGIVSGAFGSSSDVHVAILFGQRRGVECRTILLPSADVP